MEQVASKFVDTNDFSNFDKVIDILHTTGALITQIDEELAKMSSIEIKSDLFDDDADAFSRIQFSNAINKQSITDSDVSDIENHHKHKSKHDKYSGKHDKMGRRSGRKSARTSSSNSSFVGVVESVGNDVLEDHSHIFKADFSQLTHENPTNPIPSLTSYPQQNNLDNKVDDIYSLKNALREAILIINDYKTYASTLEELLRDLALGNLHLNPNDRTKFLDINRDSNTFIDNLGSTLGISINRPASITHSQIQNIPFQIDSSILVNNMATSNSATVPVFYLRRIGLASKIPFIEPISLSNYFGQHLHKPMQELLRFGNLFSISLSGSFFDSNYTFKVTLKCLTQSMDIFMSFPNSTSITSATVSQYMSKNSVAEIKDTLNLTRGLFPLLCLSIVQSDGFACKYTVTLPLGPFLSMSSNFLSMREFDSLWHSPIYTNSKFSTYELSILCYESKCALPMVTIIFEDIKKALALNELLNVTIVAEKSQTAVYQLSSTFSLNFLDIYHIDPHLFRDCSNTCLMGKVAVKCGKNKLNIKLELKSIVPVLLVSTRDCLKESLSAALSNRALPSESMHKISMDKDITLPLPFDAPVNEYLDFPNHF